MPKIYKQTIRTKDLDWFLQINGVYIHVASAGGEIPDVINNYHILRVGQKTVSTLVDINSYDEINKNEKYVTKIKEFKSLANYMESFIRIARKGFYSFDRTYITNPDDNRYHLVAWPKHHVPHVDFIPSIKSEEINFDKEKTLVEINLIDIINRAELK